MESKGAEIYIDLPNLGNFAMNVAREAGRGGMVSCAKTASAVLTYLRDIKMLASEASLAGEKTEALSWLLDNWYIAEREGKDAVNVLKRSESLPGSTWEKVNPTVLKAAGALVRAGRGEVTGVRISAFLESYQQVSVLSEKELSLFITMLKVELIAYLREAAQGMSFLDRSISAVSELPAIMENIFTSLRFLAGFDASETLKAASRMERVLSADPAGAYSKMDERTRYYYRHELSKLAEKSGMTEYDAAKYVVKLAKADGSHVGKYIFREPLGRRKHRPEGGGYFGTIVIASLFLAILLGFLLKHPLVPILLVFPISEIVKNVTDYFAVRLFRPNFIPRMELSRGVPAEGRTICVISALLSKPESAAHYSELLEEYMLANRDAGKNLTFGILADLPECREKTSKNDEALLSAAKASVEGLNSKYGGGFFLFCRERIKNESSEMYFGWEKKRGAIMELVRLLRGKNTGLYVIAGNTGSLTGVKFILTLDGDTRLTPSSAVELIGAALHPLNVPVIDEKRKIVKEGSGIFQPRIAVELEAATRSDFTKIFAGQGGIDPYGCAASDVYQDIFERGSFTGKGVINIEAYDICLEGRFPENTVLSHDLPEGAYLHCAYVGDVELTDGYPYKVLSYYERMHRWTRGDWQNIRFLARYVKNAEGKKEKNTLSEIDKWKVFDNLRRSLVPIFTFAALLTGMLLSGYAFVWAAAAATVAAASNLLISSAELVFRRDLGRKTKYHSTVISGFPGAVMQTAIRLMLLPYEAYISFTAIVTAVYRMAVSKKNLLKWVTAAECESRGKNTVLSHYSRMWICVIAGVFVAAFSKMPAAAAVGTVWLLTPAYARALSGQSKIKKKISATDKRFLLSAAGDIWRYYEDFLAPADNFLPPDNWQEQPAAGLAHRTSPTNIGLALISALAAYDLGVTTEHKALGVIENMLATIERLPKWNGHLYNWYDTRTLRTLRPEYVSTVDSGNFAGCLIALSEGLNEMGKDALAERVRDILRPMSFVPLFDNGRKLFYIGWDTEKNQPTEGWYDLLASEARQTSFIAIARGDVPRKHWRRLGRALVSVDRFAGVASWTGTMFEYLMPNLLLPCYRDSLIYESSKFCVYTQKKDASGIPWGTSESAFYAFDPALNYRYKAHGAEKLALKRGMESDTVISPYSSFLALSVDFQAAVKNLRRMREMGIEGRYGFYEAVDFTPSRQTDGDFQVVRSYMSHHLGMSLISISNALCENAMQKRFMKNREMAAFSELLQERVPIGEVVLKKLPREIPEKPHMPDDDTLWSEALEGVDVSKPRCVLLSNGAYSVLLSETGATESKFDGMALTRFKPDKMGKTCGMSFLLKESGKVVSLLPAPYFSGNARYKSEFFGKFGKISTELDAVHASVTVTVPSDETGEYRYVEFSYSGENETEAELICFFEPVLCKKQEFEAHPAFSRLSLEMTLERDAVIIRRRSRTGGEWDVLCFACDRDADFETSRERLFGRGDIVNEWPDSDKTASYSPEAIVAARIPVRLRRGETVKIGFALTVAQTGEDAIESARRILRSPFERGKSRTDSTAQALGMSISDITCAYARLTDVIYSHNKPDVSAFEGKKGLWRFGISCDVPIVSSEIEGEEDVPKALSLLREHIFLTENGAVYDLVLIISDGGDYRMPIRAAAVDFLRTVGREHTISIKGGVHLIDKTAENVKAIEAASVSADKEYPERDTENLCQQGAGRLCGSSEGPLAYGFGEDGSFAFTVKGKLPEYAWSHILANDNYGYIATDAGTGHMWHLNSRENKINRWLGDALTTEGTERIKLHIGDKTASLFAAEDGFECKVTYGMGYAKWEKDFGRVKTSLTAFVPPDVPARILLIEAEFAENADIVYYTDLVLGADENHVKNIETDFTNGVFSAKNLSNTEFSGEVFTITGSETGASVPGRDYAEIAYPISQRLVIVTGCGDTEPLKTLTEWESASASLKKTADYWRSATGTLRIKTQEKHLDDYINGWALYQTLCCRIKARTSLYQCGGAYGFRDQLQDVSALIPVSPIEAKKQIIRAAAHQFEEGDVQHWWHPTSDNPFAADKGVRTKYSDDLLWLPYVLCEYCEKTGNTDICEIMVPYLSSPTLSADESERYEAPSRSDVFEKIIDHAVKAAKLVINRGLGAHGLLLIGSGDWNDGMNFVGAKGNGESVWLTWFASVVLKKLAALCERTGKSSEAAQFRADAERLRLSGSAAWDGGWFLRGYYDDGTKLGSAERDECQIDSVAQSFSAFAGGDEESVKIALRSAYERLFDHETGIVKLFDPPFYAGEQRPGYIRGYGPGFRENGGQYTHAAVWLGLALFDAGMPGEGWDILHALLPQSHELSVYKKEPYVLAADVYTNPGNVGLGGWSWYTGAAGWYFRAITETVLGLHVRDGRLFVEPNLPPEWNGYEADRLIGDMVLHINVVRKSGYAGYEITVDGKLYDESGYDIKINN
ncbi:MAG: glucoamylase family protein [Oscillospiraceae bacterium]